MNESVALESVRRWAGPRATVSAYEAVVVPGMSLFAVTPSPSDSVFMHDYTPPRRGALIRHGDARILVGKDGLQAALDAGTSDPADVARLTLLFLHDHGEFAEDAEPPAIQGRFLVYYWRRNDMSRELMKARLDRDTLVVTIEPAL